MKLTIWYMRPEFFSDGIMGFDHLKKHGIVPDPKNLNKTHILLKIIVANDLEDAYSSMQGENWSSNGEARDLILSRGLRHISMCVGDIAVYETGIVWMVDIFGFKEI
jgi:hypothetical protein